MSRTSGWEGAGQRLADPRLTLKLTGGNHWNNGERYHSSIRTGGVKALNYTHCTVTKLHHSNSGE